MDNGDVTLDIFNKLQNFPPLNVAGNNIGRKWYAWREKFLSFIQKEDAKEIYKNHWASILLMSVGEQANKNIPQNVHQIKDLGIILRKLDMHFIFGLRKKQDNESVDEYVDSLMLVAIASNYSDPINIVREKIVDDIKSFNFTGKAMLLLRSKGEDLVPYLQSLDLHKITLLWKQCEEFMSQSNQEDVQIQPSSDPQFIECSRCGTWHGRNRCPAHGFQCNNCKGYNHYTVNCKVKYVTDCTKCGTNHVQSRCLAFGALCEKCGKTNHFSWLCQIPFVKGCRRCGNDHAISLCPAQGRVCSRCQKPNHFKEQCLSAINDKQGK